MTLICCLALEYIHGPTTTSTGARAVESPRQPFPKQKADYLKKAKYGDVKMKGLTYIVSDRRGLPQDTMKWPSSPQLKHIGGRFPEICLAIF